MIHLKLNDEILVFKVEINLASKTTKQDADEEEYIPGDADVPDVATSHNPTMQTILAMFPQLHQEDEEQYRRRNSDIKSQMQPFVTPSGPTLSSPTGTSFTR